MHFKGLDKLKEKLPKYLGWRVVEIGLLILLGFSIALTLMLFIDSVTRIFPHMTVLVLIEPILPALGVFLCEIIAFRSIWGVWQNRDRYVAEFGELAYQKAIPRGVFGISWIFAICIHIYIPIDTLPAGTPVNPITTLLCRSLISFLGIPVGLDFTIRIVLSLFIVIIGLLTIRSALLTFGFDYMALVYLYYPAESQIQKHEIYSVIRHPTYFGLLSIAMGGLWLRFSVYSLLLFFMFLFGLLAHIYFVEEKELQDRFGESFIEYQQNVPALYIRLRDLRIYIRFLTKRDTE